MKRYSILTLALPALLGLGCDAKDVLGECDPDIAAKADLFLETTGKLQTVSADITGDVFDACNAIAVSMGDTAVVPATAGKPTGDEITEACNLVKAGLRAQFMGGVRIEVAIVPPVCTVNAQASVDCKVACDVDASCDPGQLEVMCTGGELPSVSCEGSCNGEFYCDATVTAECGATCQGTCSGGCEGSCEGTAMCEGECTGSCNGTAECTGRCEGECNGECDGTLEGTNCDGNCMGECVGTCSAAVDCMGECKGTCMVAVECEGTCGASCEGSCEGKCMVAAEADCGGNVRCEGSCEGTPGTLPECEGTVEPPSCMIDAECEGGCDAQASLEAECTEGSVSVAIDAEGSAEVVTALEENLPVILQTAAKLEVFGDAFADATSAAGDLVAGVATVPACAADYGASVLADGRAALEASADVTVSINVSVSVSGCASASSNSADSACAPTMMSN